MIFAAQYIRSIMGAYLYAAVAILMAIVLMLIYAYMTDPWNNAGPQYVQPVYSIPVGGSITPADISAIAAVPPPVVAQPVIIANDIAQPAAPAVYVQPVIPTADPVVLAPPSTSVVSAQPSMPIPIATTPPVADPPSGIINTIINTVSAAFSGDCEANKDKILLTFVNTMQDTTYTPTITSVRKISDDVCEADIALASKSTGFVESTATYRFKFANNSDAPSMSLVSMAYHEAPPVPVQQAAAPIPPADAPTTVPIIVDSLSKFTKQVGKWFNMNVNQTVEQVSEIQCVDRCLDMGTKCVAVNYWPTVSRCNFISEYGGQPLYDNQYVSFYLKK